MRRDTLLNLWGIVAFGSIPVCIWFGLKNELPRGGMADLPVVLDVGETHVPPERERAQQMNPTPLPVVVFYGETLEARSVFYVLDRSSMAIEDMWYDEKGIAHGSGSGSRWQKAVTECKASLRRLDPSVLFNILVFDCGTAVFRDTMTHDVEAACAWLDGITTGNGTGTGAATAVALSARPDVVILLTDGAPTCDLDPSIHRAMIRSSSRGVPVEVFGVALDSVTREWCRAVAGDTGGQLHEVAR